MAGDTHDRTRRACAFICKLAIVTSGLTVAAAQGIARATPAHAFTAPTQVTDINPNASNFTGNLFGGRTVAFAVNPINTQVVFAATEFGGLWKSINNGSSWSHVDQVPLTAMQDVQYAPGDDNVMLATGAYDGSIDNRGGGIWRSLDGGSTWSKAPGSDVCATLASNNARKIGFSTGTGGSVAAYVGMDCGIAATSNSGGSWTLIDPTGNGGKRIWDVKTRQVSGQTQIDACGSIGYFRSSNGGATWPTSNAFNSGNFPSITVGSPPVTKYPGDPCRVGTAPQDPNAVFLALRSPVVNSGDKIGETYQLENDGGGAGSWHNLNVSTDGNGRDPSVLIAPAYAGDSDPAHDFNVYFLTDQVVVHTVCSTNNTPRCPDGTGANTSNNPCPAPGGTSSGPWSVFDGGFECIHYGTDPGDIAFDPGTGCPFLEGGDGGIIKTGNGCVNQPSFSDANDGLHALWIYQLAGSAVPAGSTFNAAAHTDVYYGMQDNGQYCSDNDAATFTGCSGADVFNTLADASGPPTHVLYNADGGFNRENEDGSGSVGFSIPTLSPAPASGDNGINGIVQFGDGRYAVIVHDGTTTGSPPTPAPNCFVYVTTNAGGSWNQMGPQLPECTGNLFLSNGEQPIVSSGTATSPVFYLQLGGGSVNSGNASLFRLSGPLTGTASSQLVQLNNSGAYWGPFNVDPANPNLIYALDFFAGGARLSTDGGATWTVDSALDQITTAGGVYPVINNATGSNISSFAFDPNSNSVLVGTQFSGIYGSPDLGKHWVPITGSQQIPRVGNFFFDTRNQGTAYVGSQGRGAWKVHLPQSDLSIAKTHSPDPVIAGTDLTWTITVTNNGPDPAPSVVVTDTLPPQASYLTNNLNPPAGCSAVAQTVTCTLGDMDVGASVTFSIVTFVDPATVANAGAPTSITNTATVTSNAFGDPNTSNDTAVDTAVVDDSADLAVSKLCKPENTVIYPQQPINCSVFTDNLGPSYARNVVVDDTTVSNGSFTITAVDVNNNGVDIGGGGCTLSPVAGGQDLSCAVGNLANQSTTQTGRVTVSYIVTATGTSVNGQSIDDTAKARSDTPDPNPNNDSATASVAVTALADESLTKHGPATVVAGTPITWTLQTSNSGPSDAANTSITDTVPAGVTITSVTMPGATCVTGVAGDPSQPTVCNLGTLSSGATSSVMTVNATVNPRTTGTLQNNARVSSTTYDGNLSNNLASTSTTVTVTASIAVAIAATPNPVTAGTPLSYQLTVSNGGPSTATAVTLTDPLPSGVTFMSTGGVGTCGFQTNTNTVTCSLPNLDPGQSEVVYIYTTVKTSTLPQNMTNMATATASGSPNGTGSVTTQVVTSADLVIVLTSDASLYKPSTTIHYTITVTNAGPSDAQHVVITDNLPAVKQGKYVSNNFGCPAPSGTTLTCSYTAVAALVTIPAGGSVTFQVNFAITGNKGTITSTATVTSATPDPNASNNTSTRNVTVHS